MRLQIAMYDIVVMTIPQGLHDLTDVMTETGSIVIGGTFIKDDSPSNSFTINKSRSCPFNNLKAQIRSFHARKTDELLIAANNCGAMSHLRERSVPMHELSLLIVHQSSFIHRDSPLLFVFHLRFMDYSIYSLLYRCPYLDHPVIDCLYRCLYLDDGRYITGAVTVYCYGDPSQIVIFVIIYNY